MKTWLVQLPPGLDLSKANESKNGEFTIGKSTYTLAPANVPLGTCTTLTLKDGKYVRSEAPTQLMELTKTVSLPKVDKSVKQARRPVPQRENLKARHFASGYLPSQPKSQKRSSLETEDSSSHKRAKIETPKKKSKKDKKDKKSKDTPKTDTPKSEKKKKSKST